MRMGWLGSLPIIKELREIRQFLYDVRQSLHELRHQLGAQARELRQLTEPIWEAAIISAQDAVLMMAPRYLDPKSLARHQAQVYSRHAQDGMIAEIFRRIGMTDRRFVEIGVENGIENNSRLLLQCGWSGVWVEGSTDNVNAIRSLFERELADGRLSVIPEFVTRENVCELVTRSGIGAEFDFLSIDIDMNTHHVWEALTTHRPRVACIEYNSSIPPSTDFAVPYRPDAAWTDGSNYFGAGLKALERIGAKLGYNLVGCDYLGVDAFFVRTDVCGDKFLEPFTAEFHYEPPRYGLFTHRGHRKFKAP